MGDLTCFVAGLPTLCRRNTMPPAGNQFISASAGPWSPPNSMLILTVRALDNSRKRECHKWRTTFWERRSTSRPLLLSTGCAWIPIASSIISHNRCMTCYRSKPDDLFCWEPWFNAWNRSYTSAGPVDLAPYGSAQVADETLELHSNYAFIAFRAFAVATDFILIMTTSCSRAVTSQFRHPILVFGKSHVALAMSVIFIDLGMQHTSLCLSNHAWKWSSASILGKSLSLYQGLWNAFHLSGVRTTRKQQLGSLASYKSMVFGSISGLHVETSQYLWTRPLSTVTTLFPYMYDAHVAFIPLVYFCGAIWVW